MKYLALVWPLKLIAVSFTFLYSKWIAHNSSIAKKLFVLQIFKQVNLRICLFLFQKQIFFYPQNCLCHVFIYLKGTSNMLLACLLRISLDTIGLGFF